MSKDNLETTVRCIIVLASLGVIFLIFIVMAIVFGILNCILFSCENGSNVSKIENTGRIGGVSSEKVYVDNHEYILYGHRGIAHSGTCKKCKQELDSIVKNAINVYIESNNKEDWNE